ncbi:hypothetical protein NDU88_004118 [Pleurodeles waltl]|uniref:Uncharacterized protein n=1 Tax=Pleurodeles waltl TaxID=8319 RepID=A0AAV7TQX7_PLEWA|nr:hypothetical protein NDU88_004118 [Pleurodeles waltl]
MGTGGGVSGKKGETRASLGGDPSIKDCTETGRPSEALPEESEAREAPSEHSGRASVKAWPPQVHAQYGENEGEWGELEGKRTTPIKASGRA